MTQTVLLVDDNASLRQLYRIGLEQVGNMRVVGEAKDGAEGITAAQALRPDIVLLDLSMPTMDGLEALPRIRKASPASHVVILTGFRAERLADIALKLGASAFIEKGVAPTQLADSLRLATATPLPEFHEMGDAERQAFIARVRDLV